ncbi:unnamed protein product [marine sediment metagenome]|uniref:Uncharacterized protein n=1 Tax=marine sediment metagenome TaxID=412755 RepID=X0TK76_9ZZZZ
MGLDGISKLGKALGNTSNEIEETKGQVSPDQTNAEFFAFANESLIINGELTASMLVYPTDSFILDHPVYGELDSAILKLDGGYNESDPEHGSILDNQTY